MVNYTYGKFITNVTRFLINYVVRFVFAGIVLYCNWMPLQDLTDWFSYHVIFCTIGFMPVMAEALMLFAGDDLWSRQLTRSEKCAVHGVLITIGTTFTIVGNLPGIYYVKPGYHLYTIHGITGLVSIVILSISIFLGLAVNYPDKTKQFIAMKPVWYKLIHNLIGLLGYALGIFSLCYAYFTDWFILHNGEISRMTALFLTIAASFWSANRALLSLYHQIKYVFLEKC